MTTTAYSRSVDLFEALMDAPSAASHETPAALFQAAGLPSSSGYRHVAALEAEGFLRRDPTGTYLPGISAVRTGFSGFGLGKIAPLAQPILLRLRQATQHTAFLAIVTDLDLHMGPYSLGRETRNVKLQPFYSFETVPELAFNAPVESILRAQEGQVVRRTTTLVAPVEARHESTVVLGLILNPGWGAADHLDPALTSACSQIINAIKGL